jgi:hypothetical protein
MAAACDKAQAAAPACCKAQKVAVETKATAAVASQQAAPSNTTAPVACTTQQTAAAQPTTTPMDPGMRAYIDPETGQLTSIPPAGTVQPTQAEVELKQVRLPDGSFMLDQKNAPEDYLILKLDANGKKVVECSQDPTKALQTPPAPQREDR